MIAKNSYKYLKRSTRSLHDKLMEDWTYLTSKIQLLNFLYHLHHLHPIIILVQSSSSWSRLSLLRQYPYVPFSCKFCTKSEYWVAKILPFLSSLKLAIFLYYDRLFSAWDVLLTPTAHISINQSRSQLFIKHSLMKKSKKCFNIDHFQCNCCLPKY